MLVPLCSTSRSIDPSISSRLLFEELQELFLQAVSLAANPTEIDADLQVKLVSFALNSANLFTWMSSFFNRSVWVYCFIYLAIMIKQRNVSAQPFQPDPTWVFPLLGTTTLTMRLGRSAMEQIGRGTGQRRPKWKSDWCLLSRIKLITRFCSCSLQSGHQLF